MWDTIKTKMQEAYNWVQDNIIKPIVGAFETFRDTVGGIWERIATKIQEKVENIKNGITTAFSTAYNNIKTIFAGIGNFFNNMWQTVKNTFSLLGTKISDAISGAVRTGINGVLSKIESTVNKFIRMINGAINIINYITNGNISKINEIYIPRLAKGGLVDDGQLFIANEAGPELVGNIGNKTAVANREQITTGIAIATYNAMRRALEESRANDMPPQLIQVNLGNKELYKGYGQYKDEQSNMLGVRI